jgi:hypothetical protein
VIALSGDPASGCRHIGWFAAGAVPLAVAGGLLLG